MKYAYIDKLGCLFYAYGNTQQEARRGLDRKVNELNSEHEWVRADDFELIRVTDEYYQELVNAGDMVLPPWKYCTVVRGMKTIGGWEGNYHAD